MKHRTGYLFKRGENYYVQWRVDGKLHMKSLRDNTGQPIKSKREAETARDAFMAPLALADEAGALKAIAEKSNTIEAKLEQARLAAEPPLEFTKAWATFLNSEKRRDEVKASKEVLENYERQLQHFGKWVAEAYPEVKALNHVTLPMAKAYRRHLASSGRSPNTVNKYLSGLFLIWKIVRTEAQITDNPWTDEAVGREEEDTTGREAFTADEVKAICERATGDMQHLFALAAMTGLRLKDCCLLKWSEADLRAGEIRKVPAKTKRFKNGKVVIPMPPVLRRILLGLTRDQSEYVLPAIADRYLNHKRDLITAIQNHIEACGIRTRGEALADGRRLPTVRGFHSFRHFFVSTTLQSGTSMLSVRKMVGHSSEWMTDKYGHVLNLAESRKAVGLLADSIDINKPAKASPESVLSECKALVKALTPANLAENKAALLALLAD
jgi:integrase